MPSQILWSDITGPDFHVEDCGTTCYTILESRQHQTDVISLSHPSITTSVCKKDSLTEFACGRRADQLMLSSGLTTIATDKASRKAGIGP